MIQERINALKEEGKDLTIAFGNLLKDVMTEKGFNELLIVPLDFEGELLLDEYYFDIVGDWEDVDVCDLNGTAITRFGIIDGDVCYHTATYKVQPKYDNMKTFSKEKRNTPWTPISECKNQEAIRTCIEQCLKSEFPWKFTKRFPGSRFLPFDFNLEEYLNTIKDSATLNFAFAGLKDVTYMDLTVLSGKLHTEIEAMFAGCRSLETIDLSNFKLKENNWGLETEGTFDQCDSLKRIILHGCNKFTVNVIKEALQHNITSVSVTLVKDDGDVNVEVKRKKRR